MKKLSDYRIREEDGKFYIEKMFERNWRNIFGVKKKKTEWLKANTDGDYLNLDTIIGLSKLSWGYSTLEEAKAKIIKWCEEPKYHYVVADYGIKELPNFAIGKKRYKIQSVPQMDISYSVGMKALTRDYGVYFIFPFDEIAKTEQQMKDEITEQECVDAIKRQVDEIFSLPLTFEEKNLELQRENARLKGIIETLIAKKK